MQPYEDSQWEAERRALVDAELAELDRRVMMTDDEVRALGYKESEQYPGYFHNDPRWPSLGVEDRYLMDHPGPDWRTKPPVVRGKEDLLPNHSFGKTPPQPIARPKRTPPPPDSNEPAQYTEAWDDEQFSGQTVEQWMPVKPQRPKIIPVRSGDAERVLQTATTEQVENTGATTSRLTGLWVCRICRKHLALWPSERAWRLQILGLNITTVFRSPIACTNCRIFEQRTVQWLGHEDYRPFWKIAIALWEGEGYPTMGKWTQKALSFRNRLLRLPASIQRHVRRMS